MGQYTILSAQWGNADHKSMLVLTAEDAMIAVSEKDHPALWKEVQEWRALGNAVAIEAPVPQPVKSDAQTMKDALLAKGVITQADLDAAKASAMPVGLK